MLMGANEGDQLQGMGLRLLNGREDRGTRVSRLWVAGPSDHPTQLRICSTIYLCEQIHWNERTRTHTKERIRVGSS
jgi:hypothetical protein